VSKDNDKLIKIGYIYGNLRLKLFYIYLTGILEFGRESLHLKSEIFDTHNFE